MIQCDVVIFLQMGTQTTTLWGEDAGIAMRPSIIYLKIYISYRIHAALISCYLQIY